MKHPPWIVALWGSLSQPEALKTLPKEAQQYENAWRMRYNKSFFLVSQATARHRPPYVRIHALSLTIVRFQHHHTGTWYSARSRHEPICYVRCLYDVGADSFCTCETRSFFRPFLFKRLAMSWPTTVSSGSLRTVRR